MNLKRIIDFFLLKKDFYARLNDKTMWLYIGIALVGIRDVGLAVLGLNISSSGDPVISFSLKTCAILFLAALVIGLIDVICFSYPIFDIIKYFKRRSDSNALALGTSYSSLLTKVMKVYIAVNIIVTPLSLLSYYTFHLTGKYEMALLVYLTAVLDVLAYFWFNGAITRGLCVLFKIPARVRVLVFMLVFVWNALLSEALGLLFTQVIIRL